jgi:hypothetical protein
MKQWKVALSFAILCSRFFPATEIGRDWVDATGFLEMGVKKQPL